MFRPPVRRGLTILVAVLLAGLVVDTGTAPVGALAEASDPPGRNPGVVHLTFDDGPDQALTPVLLDLLDRHGARATFFLLGRNLAARWGSDEVQDLLNRGHEVGNHSTHHRPLTQQHPFDVAADLAEASVILADRTGFRPSCWRAPYGDRNGMVRAVAGSLSMSHVGWTADPREWTHPWVPVVVQDLTRERHDGLVILLHDRKWHSLHIVDDLLPAFHGDGWRFEAVPDCRVPGQRGARMATRGIDDPPVGRVDRVVAADGGILVSGWAYDADAPAGGLLIRATTVHGGPDVVAETGVDHGFGFRLEADPEGPVCVWAIDAGRRQDSSLGCHREEILSTG